MTAVGGVFTRVVGDVSGVGVPASFWVGRRDEVCCVIGRHSSNDVVLSSAAIPLLCSRFHAQIRYSERAQRWYVVDGAERDGVWAPTTNGTYKDGVLVRSVRGAPSSWHFLSDGDLVSFGGPSRVVRDGVTMENPFTFRFQVIGAPGAPGSTEAQEESESTALEGVCISASEARRRRRAGAPVIDLTEAGEEASSR